MYKSRAVSRHLLNSRIGGKSIVRVSRQRQVRSLATDAAAPKSAAEASLNTSPPLLPPPPKKRRILRKTLLYTSTLGVIFYGVSTVVALNSQRYHDFFVESVPLGEPIIDLVESQGWDKALRTGPAKSAVDVGKQAYGTLEGAVSRTFGSEVEKVKGNGTKVVGQSAPPGSVKPSPVTKETVKEQAKEEVRAVAKTMVKKVEKDNQTAPHTVKEAVQDVKSKGIEFSVGVKELVEEAEAALSGKVKELVKGASSALSDAIPPETQGGLKVWNAPLPLGHQPPPGYVLPSKPKADLTKSKEPETKAAPLPLVAPAVAKLSASEPVLAQLAQTIDNLAGFLRDNPSAASGGAKDVLQIAQIDLTQLGERFEKIKEEERVKLENSLDHQAKEYSNKIVELEMDSQDKLDRQEEDWKEQFESERKKVVDNYRHKLEAELATQSEIINQRLKEEVIAQGIELQRRWIREIKLRVEQERGGRLAKLDDLATNVKRLERVTLDNSSYIDENLNVHALWSAIRALTHVVDSPTRKPFREELRVLHNVAAARSDLVLSGALKTVEDSDVPDIGVEPLADLTTWFITSVQPRIENVALVPDQDAGILSHLASWVVSKVRFRRHGLVDGNDVLSVLARAEHYMNEKDLDSASRELNQLTGWPKFLVTDWLEAARKRLEVQQALEVVQTQATLASLLVLETKK